MKQSYVKYYERYSYRFLARLFADALLSRSRLRKLAIAHRQADYLRLARADARLLALHARINRHLLAACEQWPSYDYGEGYFYQSLASIGVTGMRDTTARVEAMNLRAHVSGKRVLDIGCNSGFVALSIASAADQVTAFDVNPHLIAVARDAAEYLGLGNTDFSACSFEDFTARSPFEAVLSFANHSTYDGNTRQTIEQYFQRCGDLLAPGGLLLFESHTPQHEGDGLRHVREIIGRLFSVRNEQILDVGTFLDRGRTFIVAVKPS